MRIFIKILIIGTLLLSCSKEEAECYCEARKVSIKGKTIEYTGKWISECDFDKRSYFDGGYYEIRCNNNFE